MRRWIVTAVVTGLVALGAAPQARAGTYTVYGCDAGHGDVARNWVGFDNDSAGDLKTFLACPKSANGDGNVVHGLRQRSGDAASVTIPYGHRAGYRFTAPPGTSIAGLARQIDAAYSNSGLRAVIQSSAGVLDGCQTNGCSVYGQGVTGSLLPNVPWVETAVECLRAAGCKTDAYSGPDAALYVGTANVLLSDPNPPALANGRGGVLLSDGWLTKVQSLGFDASDASGVSAEGVKIDDASIDSHTESCDYTRAVPCPAVTSHDISVDTTKLADGTHTVALLANDATQSFSNIAVAQRTIRVDNHDPTSVTNLTAAGGEGWRASNGFSVSWNNPDQGSGAPIVAAHYRVCRTDGTACEADQRVAGDGIDQLAGISVPAPGDFTLRVWLEDAAGNASSAQPLESVHLRFDPADPGRASIATPDTWLNDAGASAHPVTLTPSPGPAAGPSGVAGYAVTLDGSDPGAAITAPGPTPSVSIASLPEGVNTVEARAISGSGVPSADIGTATVRIDRHRPDVAAVGAPDPTRWARGVVALTVTGTDQPGLSGMTPALDGQAANAGGRIVYAVDDGPDHVVRGSVADVDVGADGSHLVSVHAVDAAGNESPVRTLTFKVDGTPPGPVAFAAQDPEDPQAVNVSADDRTSGIAKGTIEIRKLGRRSWSPLRSSYDGRELHARLDDAALPPGIYSLRARVRDVAGNVTTSAATAAGHEERLRLPLRLGTRLAVSTRTHRTRACRIVRRLRTVKIRGHRTRRIVRVRVCRSVRVPGRVSRSVLVGYGRRFRIYGRLATEDGQSVAGERIAVESTRRAGHAKRLRPLATDRFGRFSYLAPPGPSRRIGFRYRGSSVLLGSRATTRVRVPAYTSLALSRHALRVGQTLRFAGRLAAPVPRSGVLVQVQAVVRGHWQTFATPRTDRHGRWAANYTFRATAGVVTYAFRAFVARAADYPYEAGASGVARATVRG